jgi:choline-phosphate cytidylyltransferase
MYQHTDFIYVASPHETHYGYVKDALLHGKHVLCEKPFVLEKDQAEELFNIAKERNLILFEGIKTAFCPGFNKLVDVACSGLIGSIKYVEACFTKLENPNNRELTDTRYGGSFLELGSYCLLPVLKLLGTDCEDVKFDSIYNEKNIDIFTKASFKFPKGLATVTCGLGVKSEGRLLIAGTRGYITVEAPWWKTTYFEAHFEDENEVDKFSEHFLGYGLRYEVSDMLNQINGNGKSEFKLTRGESIAMAGIMERFIESENRTKILI